MRHYLLGEIAKAICCYFPIFFGVTGDTETHEKFKHWLMERPYSAADFERAIYEPMEFIRQHWIKFKLEVNHENQAEHLHQR